ncbi:hypothetical protein WA026_019689 [Henosepilachna vigintioctopunctata]|uniref:Alpha-carbonic anhydrase domain-containing protein n=1 Tax=Henosepilachna vigintioctopunctata TaxID=420089 RepID=A0AAW1UI45_9CUCU
MWEYFSFDFLYIFLGIFVLVYLAVYEYINYATNSTNKISSEQQTVGSYGYGLCNGPHTWRQNFLAAQGECQSPVNLQSECAIVVHVETLTNPLEFSREYCAPPCDMFLINDGHTINIYPEYGRSNPPTIQGGPLDREYELYGLCLRWGPNDEEGSEHMVDNKRYAMEMQVTFMCRGHRNLYIAAEAGDVIMVAYMFQATHMDNPYLDEILSYAGSTNIVFEKFCIETVPISLLAPCFSKGYYSYVGSLTYPPCTEGVRWIVQPEPLSVSYDQMKRLRKTPMIYCDLKNNTRPVQELHNREIIFYD